MGLFYLIFGTVYLVLCDKLVEVTLRYDNRDECNLGSSCKL